MDLAEYGCTGCVLGGADRHRGALLDVEAATSPTNHALTSGPFGMIVPISDGGARSPELKAGQRAIEEGGTFVRAHTAVKLA